VTPTLDNRISLQKLQVFCHVVKLGTVTRAAERLFVAQPVVTAHLQLLEQRLGVKLFVRQGRTLQLTAAGERVHAWAAATIVEADVMMAELQGLREGTRGTALIGASMSLGTYRLPSVVAAFRRERPLAEISLAISDPETAVRAVELGQLDFCIVLLDEQPYGEVLDIQRLGEEDLVLVAAPDAEPTTGEITVEDLADLPMVASPRGSVRRGLVDQALALLHAPSYRPVIEFGHPEALKLAVAEGLGATFLCRCSVEDELRAGTLREVRISGVDLTLPVFVVKRSDKHLSVLQTRLLSAITDDLSTLAPALLTSAAAGAAHAIALG
jgi:DNA-binding transcriptional LysR family regulator